MGEGEGCPRCPAEQQGPFVSAVRQARAGSWSSRRSLFPVLLQLPDIGLPGHRCFTSHDRGGGDFITPAGSSFKRLGSLPFPKALLAECFRLSFPAITLLGICLKGLILKKEKKGSVPSWSRNIYYRKSWCSTGML